MLRRRARPASEAEVLGEVAAQVLKAAALLGAGASAAVARAELALERRSLQAGALSSEQVAHAAWEVVAAVWQLAEKSGAPLAAALRRVAAALRQLQAAARQREVLLATPRLTAQLINWLPLVAVAMAVLLGFDPFPIFFSGFGVLLLLLAAFLQILGRWWIAKLLRRAVRHQRVAGLECELLWIALLGGAPPALARVLVADAMAGVAAANWLRFSALCRDEPLAEALRLASAAGASAQALLLDSAQEQRRVAAAQLARDTERLGVQILLPLAVCSLPAFLAVGVVPVVVRLLGLVVSE